MTQDPGTTTPTPGQLAMFPAEDRYGYPAAAAYLGVSVRTLQRWVAEGLVGFVGPGRRVYFTKAQLDEAVTRHTRAAKPVAKTRKARAS